MSLYYKKSNFWQRMFHRASDFILNDKVSYSKSRGYEYSLHSASYADVRATLLFNRQCDIFALVFSFNEIYRLNSLVPLYYPKKMLINLVAFFNANKGELLYEKLINKYAECNLVILFVMLIQLLNILFILFLKQY